MRMSKKAITLILLTLFIFSIFGFTTSTFAADEKISPELSGKIKDNPKSLIPVIVQTQQGLKEKHKTLI